MVEINELVFILIIIVFYKIGKKQSDGIKGGYVKKDTSHLDEYRPDIPKKR